MYSHGKGSIARNAAAAEAAGLKILGISDHGPGHIGFGIKMARIPDMRRDIAAASEAHPDLVIKLGVEANIINHSGALDIGADEIELFDFIIAGYHFGVFGEIPFKSLATHIGGIWYSLSGSSSQRRKNSNTDLVLSALEKNRIDIISHPGAKAAFDIGAIARACEGRETLLEINNSHGFLNAAGIKEAAEYDVGFIIGSDAHRPGDIGSADRAIKTARQAGLEASRIINLRKECAWN